MLSPPARWSHSSSYDPIRGHTLIFGGAGTKSSYHNDTWAYVGKTWVQLQSRNTPGGRHLHRMVHSGTGTLMFGGTTSTSRYLAETWVWDGKDWTQINTATSPPGREVGAMAYDSARQRVVLFGGSNKTGLLNDTWEFDFKNWTRVMTRNSPSPRYTNLVYDSARKRIVLFGGRGGRTGYLNDTWEYNGRDWTLKNPAARPSARVGVGMAYDASRQRTVLFGGVKSAARPGGTWEYDGDDWIEIRSTTQPAVRYDFDNMVYDSRRKRMVVFGGNGIHGTGLADTWEYALSQPLTANPSTVSIATGGTQKLLLDASPAHARRLYWVLGSVSGTSPGVTLFSSVETVALPLNPDVWTDSTMTLANSALLSNTRGTLDASGRGSATFNVPKITNQSVIGLKFYHAYLIYDVQSNFYLASNPVTLTLVK